MATLAELRARKTAKLPERDIEVCLDHTLLRQVEQLTAEKEDLQSTEGKPVRKMAEGTNPRIAEIDAEIEALYSQMREASGKLTLRAVSGGAWALWKDEHPPREGNPSDERLAIGLVNSTDLLDDLGRWVVAWNGEPLAQDDWDGWLAEQVAPGDLADLVQQVVFMQEGRSPIVPKSSVVSSETTTTGDA